MAGDASSSARRKLRRRKCCGSGLPLGAGELGVPPQGACGSHCMGSNFIKPLLTVAVCRTALPPPAPLPVLQLGATGNFMDRSVVFAAQHLEEAWAWGYDVDVWRAHLNLLTWPEVLRQVRPGPGGAGSCSGSAGAVGYGTRAVGPRGMCDGQAGCCIPWVGQPTGSTNSPAQWLNLTMRCCLAVGNTVENCAHTPVHIMPSTPTPSTSPSAC